MNKWQWLAIAAIVALLVLLANVLTPFLVAAGLGYLFAPLVHKLVAWRWPRVLAVITVLVLVLSVFVSVLLLILPLLQHESALITQRLPHALLWLENQLLPRLSQLANSPVVWDLNYLRQQISAQLPAAQDLFFSTLSSLGSSGLSLFGFFAKVVLVPVILFYLLLDWPLIVKHSQALLPRPWLRTLQPLLHECDEVLGSYVRGQASVMICLALFYTTGLWLTGLDVALSVGLITGLLSFIPYLGFTLGLVLGCIAGLLQFADPSQVLWVVMVFAAGQILEGMVLQPFLLGNKIGLHPVAVIFALLAFGELFGFTGVLLALPAAAVIVVMLRHLRAYYQQSSLYQGDVASSENSAESVATRVADPALATDTKTDAESRADRSSS